ncbi:hypothetical protein ACFV2X_44340 [Streptomyces sp. NPDC059679]|uniref:hypothetical protein n=1 Tax=Streptomyces sp. NPDC059679 TaxID=3346903 RepID=UPI00367A34CD
MSAEPAGTGGTVGSAEAASAAVARPVRPFALKDVALSDGPYATKRRLMLGYGRRTMVGALVEVRDALREEPRALGVPGRFGTAVEQIRGSYQYIDLPADVLGAAGALTLSAWTRPAHTASWAARCTPPSLRSAIFCAGTTFCGGPTFCADTASGVGRPPGTATPTPGGR